MIKIVKSVSEWKNIYSTNRLSRKTIGFVPTMGALHKGHASLIKQSKEENEITVVSIFINPTQFNDPNDLENYPRKMEEDLKLLEEHEVDFLFYPGFKEMYADSYRYKIVESAFSKQLCGAFRPGHFDGVLTVVMKLLNTIKPNNAYFGEKDYQQLKLIEGMAQAFFLDVKIVGCATVRDEDGLALSSRNLLLTPEERELALNFPRVLHSKKSSEEIKIELEKLGINVEYIEEQQDRIIGAIHIGNVRLIDNVQL